MLAYVSKHPFFPIIDVLLLLIDVFNQVQFKKKKKDIGA
jgi:hypothetical protein